MGTLGFSYIGLIFLLCLFVPNSFYSFNLPVDSLKVNENKILLAFEKAGQVLCTIFLIIFSDFNISKVNLWSIWLVVIFVLLILYLLCWLRYFSGKHTSNDLYRPFLDIPLPLAVLPVMAVFTLSIYGKVIWLLIASIILGIGHIGITAQHWTAAKKS